MHSRSDASTSRPTRRWFRSPPGRIPSGSPTGNTGSGRGSAECSGCGRCGRPTRKPGRPPLRSRRSRSCMRGENQSRSWPPESACRDSAGPGSMSTRDPATRVRVRRPMTSGQADWRAPFAAAIRPASTSNGSRSSRRLRPARSGSWPSHRRSVNRWRPKSQGWSAAGARGSAIRSCWRRSETEALPMSCGNSPPKSHTRRSRSASRSRPPAS